MTKKIKKFGARYAVAIAFLGCAAIIAASMFLSAPSSAAGKKTKIDTPIIGCGTSTQVSIGINVCAPSGQNATGLPAGFSLQWVTKQAYQLGPDELPDTADDNTWPASDSPGLCKASFSGNANLSRYNLLAGECVLVKVGDFLLDEGASTNCADVLECETTYEFRAFGHATSALNRSDFTGNQECSTLPCGGGDNGNCTLTQGYWKAHGPIPTGNNTNTWPVTSLTLGTVPYTDLELQSIFNTPAGGNGLIALAHQLIAAKLNVAKGADDTAVANDIAAADLLIGGLVVPPVGAGSLPSSVTSALTGALANFNEGGTGPGHCGN